MGGEGWRATEGATEGGDSGIHGPASEIMGTRASISRDPGRRATMSMAHIAFVLTMGTRASISRDPGRRATMSIAHIA